MPGQGCPGFLSGARKRCKLLLEALLPLPERGDVRRECRDRPLQRLDGSAIDVMQIGDCPFDPDAELAQVVTDGGELGLASHDRAGRRPRDLRQRVHALSQHVDTVAEAIGKLRVGGRERRSGFVRGEPRRELANLALEQRQTIRAVRLDEPGRRGRPGPAAPPTRRSRPEARSSDVCGG